MQSLQIRKIYFDILDKVYDIYYWQIIINCILYDFNQEMLN